MTRPQLLLGVLALGALVACGERPQDLAENGNARSAPAYQGTGVASFTAPGWKAGDEKSWAQELRTRGERGQNDYTRIGAR